MSLLTNIIPQKTKNWLKKKQAEKLRAEVLSKPVISIHKFREILENEMELKAGDTLFIHSSMDKMNIDFPAYKAINSLLEIVGENGTILFPAYPKLSSYKFLKSGEVFNIKKTPSYTGILTEFARRHSKAKRSLHPTKSVVAIGRNAEYLTSNHHLSPYPYSKESPYWKIGELEAKVIGIGVKTTFLSAVHSIDDIYLDKMPIQPYHKELFNAKCIDYDGNEVVVPTYAHILSRMSFDLPAYFAKHIDKSIVRDFKVNETDFFIAHSKEMFQKMTELANKGITIYKF